MAKVEASNTPVILNKAISVIGPQFCAPNNVDLIITKKLMTIAYGRFLRAWRIAHWHKVVLDVKGNLVFKIKGKFSSIRDRRVLLDAANIPIVSMQPLVLTAHSRWEVYRGDSSSSKDLLFSVKKSSLIQFQFNTQLDVFLASNIKQDICDFKIEGSWLDRSCVIYSGISGETVAQMCKKHSAQNFVLNKDTFSVTVYPHVDHAFITVLIAILKEINEPDINDY